MTGEIVKYVGSILPELVAKTFEALNLSDSVWQIMDLFILSDIDMEYL